MGRVCLLFKENIGFMQRFLILRPDVNRREYTLIDLSYGDGTPCTALDIIFMIKKTHLLV